ncbi:MAG: Txe/YoeB family addiction module toxin [Prevotella sp.]|nr:Txe/YoeB family addiction module toxin [Prevotella sp.]
MYKVILSPKALADAGRLKQSEPKAYQKLVGFIEELKNHPKTGTGHPEPLKGKPEGRWSRQITKKHRLIYRIYETEVYVDVLSAYGHYEDK